MATAPEELKGPFNFALAAMAADKDIALISRVLLDGGNTLNRIIIPLGNF